MKIISSYVTPFSSNLLSSEWYWTMYENLNAVQHAHSWWAIIWYNDKNLERQSLTRWQESCEKHFIKECCNSYCFPRSIFCKTIVLLPTTKCFDQHWIFAKCWYSKSRINFQKFSLYMTLGLPLVTSWSTEPQIVLWQLIHIIIFFLCG